jgi:L-amino acid N-acyltransferase YncA
MPHSRHASGSEATAPVEVRSASPADADALASIYNPYVRETQITFEEAEVTGSEMARRLREIEAASLPWLVAQRGPEVVGYAYAAMWRARSAYRFSTEVTVYIQRGEQRRGIGSLLLGELIAELRSRKLHVAIGGIALPNEASVALHEKFGFRRVARFEQVGFKLGRWIDVGYWQLLL